MTSEDIFNDYSVSSSSIKIIFQGYSNGVSQYFTTPPKPSSSTTFDEAEKDTSIKYKIAQSGRYIGLDNTNKNL